MISIVIPAHNEEAAISRCLDTLLENARPGELEIIVACNGCTDRTAPIARAYGPPVHVVETKVASKTAALNLGDAKASGFPRFYIDADVALDIDSIRKIADVLRNGSALAASPAINMNLHGASWCVRAYYAVWTALPYTREGMMGTGVYALSEEGRARFEQFPPIIADDGYIRALFKHGERTAVPEATSKVQAPRTLRDLVRIKTRSRLGFYELRQKFPQLTQHEDRDKQYGRAVLLALAHPRHWLAMLPYLWVNLTSRYRAKRQLRNLDTYRWERDESSRQG